MRKQFQVCLLALLLSLNFVPPVHAATNYYLAFQGPITGPEAYLGTSQLSGVEFAIKKFNAVNPNFNVQLIKFDDQGDPAIANTIAPSIDKYPGVIGLIGPSYSGASIVSLPYYKSVGLPVISPTASRRTLTNPGSSDFGGPIFHRLVAEAGAEGQALASWAVQDVVSPKVFLINDQSDYGVTLCQDAITALKSFPGVIIAGIEYVQDNTTDFSPTIAKLKASNANVVIQCAYPNQTGPFVRQLRGSGSDIVFASGEASLSDGFLSIAGTAASNGARLVGVPSLSQVNPKLEAELQDTIGRSSGPYSVAAIDATNMFLAGISKGVTTRSQMLDFIKSYGIASVNGFPFSFTSNGAVNGKTLFNFMAKEGAIRLLGESTFESTYYTPWVDSAIHNALKELSDKQRTSLEEMTALALQLNSKVSEYVKLYDDAVKNKDTLATLYSNSVIKISELTKLLVEKDAVILELKTLNAQVQKTLDENQIAITNLKNEISSATQEIASLRSQIPKLITCIKGKTVKKITAVNPKCPAGYKKQ
jgi:branched-chain amino acid transport system substrate-binding protein